MERYTYRPFRFYITVFASTWLFWILALIFNEGKTLFLLMFLGLLSPAAVALITVLTSKSVPLKQDLKRKVIGFYRLKPMNIFLAIIVFSCIIFTSILISVFLGGFPKQFSFTEDFSFSIGGASAFLTIFLASVIEEVGWRGYGEDSVAAYHIWFVESIIFGLIWSCWHLPLFWIQGTYHYGLKEMGALYMFNFLISVIPMGFITTWVYVRNNRSMQASIIFHLFINVMQEKIAMTPETKCIESVVVTFVAIVIVLTNKDMFFEREHIGNLLGEFREP